LYISFRYALGNAYYSEDIKEILNLTLFKIYCWKIASISFNYILARFFTEIRTLLKYQSLINFAYMGILGGFIYVTKIDCFNYLSDTRLIIEIFKDENFSYLKSFFVFGL